MKLTTPSNRRSLGIGFLVTGVLLSIAAVIVLAGLPGSEVGDIESAETIVSDSERPSRPLPSNSNTAPVESESPPTTVKPTPIWQPNPDSALAEVNRVDQDPSPVGLRIPRISVDAPVEPHGVDPDTGQMDVPNNVTEVGWYEFGPKPGQPGSAVLAAHVDLEGRGPGVFFDLEELAPGDQIRVRYDDGSEATFEVEARAIYPKDELPLDVIFRREGTPVLTLVTCGGGFDSSSSSYDSNVVVYARPMPERAEGGTSSLHE